MNRSAARQIAETITNQQIQQMFENAKAQISDWTVVSKVNKGMTKGTAWNILAAKFDVDAQHYILAKRNMVWEFGDYLPDNLKPKKKAKGTGKPPVHQEPKF